MSMRAREDNKSVEMLPVRHRIYVEVDQRCQVYILNTPNRRTKDAAVQWLRIALLQMSNN